MLRDLLGSQLPLPPSRVAEDTVVEQVAELLTSGRLHVHAQKMEAYAAGGGAASGKESTVAFPISEHQRRNPEPAPQSVDLPSFPARANLSAQAATLVAAAAAGIPFVPV